MKKAVFNKQFKSAKIQLNNVHNYRLTYLRNRKCILRINLCLKKRKVLYRYFCRSVESEKQRGGFGGLAHLNISMQYITLLFVTIALMSLMNV